MPFAHTHFVPRDSHLGTSGLDNALVRDLRECLRLDTGLAQVLDTVGPYRARMQPQTAPAPGLQSGRRSTTRLHTGRTRTRQLRELGKGSPEGREVVSAQVSGLNL